MRIRVFKVLLALLLIAGNGLAQTGTRVDLRNQTREVDFSIAVSTRPVKTGASLPAQCATGELYFKTDAAPGANLYGCVATNTWSALPSTAGIVPAPGGQDGLVLVTAGGAGQWQALGGDVSGAPSGALVTGLRGRVISSNAPGDGEVLYWNATTSQWEPRELQQEGGIGIAIQGPVVSTDDAVVPFYYAGSGVPTIACETGRDYYVDQTAGTLYYCKGTNLWQVIPLTGEGVSVSGKLNTPASNGLAVSTGGDGSTGRSLAGTANEVTVANGDGIAGNPTIALADRVDLTGKSSTLPVKAGLGSSAPASCTANQELYIMTDAPLGEQLRICNGSGTGWNLIAGAGSGTGLSDPGADGIMKRTAPNTTSPATAADFSTPVSCSDSGTSDAYTCSLTPAIAQYQAGTQYRFRANTANLGEASLSLNGLGAVPIKKVAGGVTTTLADSDILAGQWVDVVYDGTNFQMQSTLGNANAASGGGGIGTIWASNFNYGAIAAGVTRYWVPFTASLTTTLTASTWVQPVAATAKNLYVKTMVAQPEFCRLKVTLMKGSVWGSLTATDLSVSIAQGSAVGLYSNLTAAVSVAQGEYLAVRMVSEDDGGTCAGNAQLGTVALLAQ